MYIYDSTKITGIAEISLDYVFEVCTQKTSLINLK